MPLTLPCTPPLPPTSPSFPPHTWSSGGALDSPSCPASTAKSSSPTPLPLPCPRPPATPFPLFPPHTWSSGGALDSASCPASTAKSSSSMPAAAEADVAYPPAAESVTAVNTERSAVCASASASCSCSLICATPQQHRNSSATAQQQHTQQRGAAATAKVLEVGPESFCTHCDATAVHCRSFQGPLLTPLPFHKYGVTLGRALFTIGWGQEGHLGSGFFGLGGKAARGRQTLAATPCAWHAAHATQCM